MSLANGQVIMYNGYVCGKGGNIITTSLEKQMLDERGLIL